MKLISLSLIALFFLGCQKQESQQQKAQAAAATKIKYKSDIAYVYSPIEDSKQVAIIEGEPVSWSQLNSQDVALKELQQRYNDLAIGFAYAWAKKQGEKPSVKINLEASKRDMKDILNLSNIEGEPEAVAIEYLGGEASNVLAEMDGKKLTWMEFQKANVVFGKAYDKLFQQRMQRLNGIVKRRLLLQATKKANLPMEEYVRKNILGSDIKVTNEQIVEFAKNSNISEKSINDKLRERLTSIIRQKQRDEKIEAFVAKNLLKEPVKVSFKAPASEIKTPDLAENIPQWGKSGPHVVFVGSWSCRDCEKPFSAFLKLREAWSDRARGSYIYSFSNNDRELRMVAEASLCVKSLKEASFWAFLEKVQGMDETDVEKRINATAEASGIDFESFRSCFLKREFKEAIAEQLALASEMGVVQPPLLLFNGEVMSTDDPLNELQTRLKEFKGQNTSTKRLGFFARIMAFFGLS